MTENGVAFSSEDAKRILDAHLRVGRGKPVSYLPINTIENVLKIAVPAYVALIESSGSQYMVFSSDESCINSGAVYAYKVNELEAVLNLYRKTLSENEWPADPSGFVKRIASEWIEADSPLMPIIKRVFGETSAKSSGSDD